MRGAFAIALLLCGYTAHAAKDGAEYAARWDPSEGGPQTIEAVRSALGLGADKEEEYRIRYFSVPQPGRMPETFKATGRFRLKDGKGEATYKVRGEHPAPDYLHSVKCPLVGEKPDEKFEVDVVVTASGRTLMYSYSCSVAAASFAAAAQLTPEPVAKECESRMTRVKADDYKLERWTFLNGKTLFDVSWSRKSVAKGDAKAFKSRIVDRLKQATGGSPARPPRLIGIAKTELGDC